ncbi:type II toxin-antitoxin system RelE/ParE family toxin [Scytonema sp. UIC 10036]|uniref:type II toxin-antitoxin system RelE/ParE family toxin n=1 Tax=Scytonema sp. UIC 10036 TaxID=2304196 RepID=UPI0012DAC45A|nr:type II toxin-antitoxin system RelE/ParE family toxin [Scytonema sp. UIC 10036]MUG96654.1 type II toxin-antitoxin system RelE/ParE family toxin [Scytonema sp. UIC 10036]
MQYSISLEASRDLDDILDYFLTRDIEAGERFLREFNKKCQYLTRFPNIGRSYSNFDPTLRGIPLNSYIIFYRLFEDKLVIARVVSGYRDLESLFSDSNLDK